MLKHLHIENLGIISSVDVVFTEGLNVLTGETGVGKSMLLAAIALIGGAKASDSLIKAGTSRLTVVGTFDFSSHPLLLKQLQDADCETGEDNMVEIRRLVSADGRNRVFINDVPVPLKVLRTLAGRWFDIHGQTDSHSLTDAEEQLRYLDACAGSAPLLQKYQEVYRKYRKVSQELEKLVREEESGRKERELLLFQTEELEAASLRENEEEELDEELNTLTHIEQIKASCYEGMMTLDEGEGSVSERLSAVSRSVSVSGRYDTRLEPLHERLLSLTEEVKDIAYELRSVFDTSEYSKERLDAVNERIQFLNDLARKYSCDVAELIPLHRKLQERLQAFTSEHERKNILQEEKKKLFKELNAKGEELASHREKAAELFAEKLMEELAPLNMEKARFAIRFLYTEAEGEDAEGIVLQRKGDTPLLFNENGIGNIRFDISANPGEPLKPLGETVSGGELSRIMLAVKSMLSAQDDLPTLIFDEIDTGIGGHTAHRVGEKLKKISGNRQVITISHLPQIALQADTHFKIEKEYHEESTETSVTPLSFDERVDELLRMFGDTGSQDNEQLSRQFVLRLLEEIRQ